MYLHDKSLLYVNKLTLFLAAMNKNQSKLKAAVRIGAFLLFCFTIFFLGVLYAKGDNKGFKPLLQEQGVNVFFGIVGGLTTTAIIILLKPFYDSFRFLGPSDFILTGVWDECYVAEDFPEKKQEQELCFKLIQRGEIISGTLIGTDSKDLPAGATKYGTRIFKIQGRMAGTIISLDAVLESDTEYGHTVYLMRINETGRGLDGESLYFDLNHRTIASSKSSLTKRDLSRKMKF
jgi:hypothetical protein